MRKKPEPRTFEVLSTEQVTQNMRRVSIGGDVMADFPTRQDGGYVKLLLPAGDGSSRPLMRTYTIRQQTPQKLDIDFALHGDHGEGGPAVRWARKVRPGDKIRVGGPGPSKPFVPGADWYFAIGDMTALPAISVNLAALSKDAVGHAVIEIQSEADKQELDCPTGIKIHWIVNPHPGPNPDMMEQAVRSVPWHEGQVSAWSATEFEVMRRIRNYIRGERGLGTDQLYISSYWKSGLIEDQHREVKNADAQENKL